MQQWPDPENRIFVRMATYPPFPKICDRLTLHRLDLNIVALGNELALHIYTA